MCSLTYELISSKSKGKPFDSIKKLNCWASNLKDVTLLREMTHLEVLTLSVNQITTLKDIQFCTELRELYIRDNKIADINEIFYLKNLKKLKILWLADNECSRDSMYDSSYRLTVIRNLPNLQKLDNSNVTSEEIENALKLGTLIQTAPDEAITCNPRADQIEIPIFESVNTNMYDQILPINSIQNEMPNTEQNDPKTSFDKKLEEVQSFILSDSESEKDFSKASNRTVDIGERRHQKSESSHHASSNSLDSNFEQMNQNSNTLSAILLLLNDLDSYQLQTVLEACETKKMTANKLTISQ